MEMGGWLMADRRSLEAVNIRWHLGFYGAAEIEFLANKGDLDFTREYNLGKEPLRVDLLVVRKLADSPIENESGHIFKRHNVIEYKSPEDELSIDDFYKTVGYPQWTRGHTVLHHRFAILPRYCRSAYVQYASFQCLAESQI